MVTLFTLIWAVIVQYMKSKRPWWSTYLFYLQIIGAVALLVITVLAMFLAISIDKIDFGISILIWFVSAYLIYDKK